MKVKEFFFTAFYSGYAPAAPGTAGTLVAMALYIIENIIFSDVDPFVLNLFNLVFIILIIYPSIKLGDAAEKFYNTKDPQQVVLDEVLGYWIGILFIPFSFTSALLAFAVFRIFDIIKPFPAGNLEYLSGGLGIMIDDIIAGIYTLIIMQTIVHFLNQYSIILP